MFIYFIFRGSLYIDPGVFTINENYDKKLPSDTTSAPQTPAVSTHDSWAPPTLRRRHSELNLRVRHGSGGSERKLPRFSCASRPVSLVNWSEYTVRKSLVKFRTRKSVRHGRRGELRRPPSQTIKTVLENRYELCRHDSVPFEERLWAVVLSWFYGWIIDLYYIFTDEGRQRSFFLWLLASLLVTMATVSVLAAATFAFYYVNLFLLHIFNSVISFCFLLLTTMFCTLAVVAVLRFD